MPTLPPDALHSSPGSPYLKIALLTLDFAPRVGGMQQYLFEICRRVGRQCNLTVVHPDGNPTALSEEPFQMVTFGQNRSDGFSAEGNPRSTPGTVLLTTWRIARALTALQPHLTVVGHAHPLLLLPAALSRRPYIALAYGNDFEAAQLRWHSPIFNRLLASARPLVTISHANAQRLQELGLPPPELLLPGTNPDRFTPPASPPSGPPILLTVARLVSRKGIDTVLRALPPLLDQTPGLQYWIVGSGPARHSLAQLARKLKLSHAVRFMDAVSDFELPEVYQKATIFVMTSRAEYHAGSVEGFGIVYLEASACGLPVVAARSGGAAEAVIENETGLLVPPDDPQALTQALTRLLNDPTLRQRLGSAGRRWVENEMNWDRVGLQFMSIIERAL
ncbi:MAG: glycosyltransferase family 4 protein [Caldilineaceae bacterium]|nr:glycosyltransferase family 4 protein [Caldilineaceae bacterium]